MHDSKNKKSKKNTTSQCENKLEKERDKTRCKDKRKVVCTRETKCSMYKRNKMYPIP